MGVNDDDNEPSRLDPGLHDDHPLKDPTFEILAPLTDTVRVGGTHTVNPEDLQTAGVYHLANNLIHLIEVEQNN